MLPANLMFIDSFRIYYRVRIVSLSKAEKNMNYIPLTHENYFPDFLIDNCYYT
jgi:hypothetical protein